MSSTTGIKSDWTSGAKLDRQANMKFLMPYQNEQEGQRPNSTHLTLSLQQHQVKGICCGRRFVDKQ